MINAYDFDGTIYKGDASIDFYLFCLKRKPIMIMLIPKIIYAMILYKLGKKEKEYFKEVFFTFVSEIKDIDNCLEIFWNKKRNNIKKWYLKQKRETDIIISASPEFLLLPICKELKIGKLIASNIDKYTGKFISKNCYGEEKVKRYKKEVNKEIKGFYSDSMSDKPMMDIAKEKYLVRNNRIIKLK